MEKYILERVPMVIFALMMVIIILLIWRIVRYQYKEDLIETFGPVIYFPNRKEPYVIPDPFKITSLPEGSILVIWENGKMRPTTKEEETKYFEDVQAEINRIHKDGGGSVDGSPEKYSK